MQRTPCHIECVEHVVRVMEKVMAEKRNLTIQLDAATLHRARILAVERSMSVSRLVAEELERLVGDEERYQVARRQALADLESGFHLGGGPYTVREDLYDRRSQDLR